MSPVPDVRSFVDSVVARSSPTASEEASTAVRPTAEELTPSVSTEAAARPAGEAASEAASEEASKVETATADELATLLAAGLEPREGVPGLFLRRDEDDEDVPPEPIKLEGRAQELAYAMRDELATLLTEKGTEGLPTTALGGEERTDLRGAWLQGADLREAQLQGAGLVRAQLQGAQLYEAQLEGAYLEGAQLQKAYLYEAQLQGANLCRAQLQGAYLYKAQLTEANFSKAQLQGAYLSGADLQGANFEAAQLEGANISWVTNMQKASFVGANLSKANLAKSNLAGADFTSADLTKANLNESLESMRNYRPPHPPELVGWVRSRSWRTKSVAKSTGVAVFKKLAQEDDDDDDSDGDSDGDSSGSEDGDDGSDGKSAPWLNAAGKVAAEAAGALVVVAQPVLVVVSSTVAELEQLCNELAERVPEALVRSILPLNEKRSAQLQEAVATRLKGLINTCVLDLVFDEALPGAMRALKKQIEHVLLCVKEKKPLDAQGMVEELKNEMSKLCEKQQELVDAFAKGFLPPATTLSKAATTPIKIYKGKEGEESEEEGEESEGEESEDGDFASEIIGALLKMLEEDLKQVMLPDLKKQAQLKLDAFAKSASMPIAIALDGAKSSKVVQLAAQLPEVRGYIEVLKKELCQDALRKRITKGLMGAASKPLQGIGHGAQQTLALSVKFDQHLNKELKTVDEAAQKLLRRNYRRAASARAPSM